MNRKITMLIVWYYEDVWSWVFGIKQKTLIKPDELDDFRKNVYSVLKVKRKKIKID